MKVETDGFGNVRQVLTTGAPEKTAQELTLAQAMVDLDRAGVELKEATHRVGASRTAETIATNEVNRLQAIVDKLIQDKMQHAPLGTSWYSKTNPGIAVKGKSS
jgi:hypothetical protein